MLEQSISKTSFSRFGSYMAITLLEGDRYKLSELPDGIWLRSVHGDSAYEVMQLELVQGGNPVDCQISLSPSTLTLSSEQGRVDICFPTQDTVRVRAYNTTLRITARPFRNHGAIPEPDGNWVFNLAQCFRSYRLVPLQGTLEVDAPWTTKRCEHIIANISATGEQPAELVIEELTWARPAGTYGDNFDQITAGIDAEFESFAAPYLSCPEEYKETALRAAYLNWSSVVHPHRLITRPAIYMSKNWMTNVWAWDHAFNALGTCFTDTDLAWDQLMIIFDHQHDNGQIPDFTNDVRYLTVFVKPPIHGWILSRMIEFSGPLPQEHLQQAYDKLAKWTDWWFTFRDPDGDGLPVYWHGNDSGWDNGTVFDTTLPLKAADLASFLVVQMDVLADMAEQLNRPSDAATWRKRADRTFHALIDTLWDGTRFRCISTVTGESASPSDSVFGCLPIVLGNRLPSNIREQLTKEIRRHITDWGVATEHPDSSVYKPGGYWRGPIWAPPTMILVDGLRRAGEAGLARDIAQRFCNLCRRSGFAENFDAMTGAPRCDLGYTWTSSVFLTLVNRYLDK